MIEALIVIGGVIGVAAVGLFVSGRMTRWWSSALYALMTAALGVLMASGFYALSDASNTIAVVWHARLSAVSVVVALTCLYFLVQEIIDVARVDTAEKIIRWVVFWLAFVVLLLSFTPAIFYSAYVLPNREVFINTGWGISLYILFMIGVLVLIGVRILEEIHRTYRQRHGVLDVRFVAVRTLSYLLTLAAVAMLFCVFAVILSELFAADMAAYNAALPPVMIVAAVLAALTLQPLKRQFNRLIDGIFYKDNYSMSQFVARINQTLNSTNDLRTLLERTADVIASTMHTSQAFFFVNLLEGRYMTAGTEGHARVTLGELEAIEVSSSKAPHGSLVTSQFDKAHPTRRMMVSHRLGLIQPLYKGETLVGFLCLGKARTRGYTNRDLRALGSIADELTIAIQNALSVDEVRKLNDTLEQRIGAATKELRTSNAQLQRLDEAKDEFISMASHQLRTPLTSIKGYISMLIEGDVGEVTKEQKHLLNEAFISSERMVRLIGDFLNVSRLQTGKFIIDKHPVDLALLVQREVDGLEQNASARGMKFVYKRPKNLPRLDLDENKIQQVVMNFADNAIFYSKEKSKITVSLKKTGAFVEFKVIDTGIGVPKSEQAHLFNKFFRATNARRARPDGTGVGLFLAKKVITDHGGSIIFESKEGKGSTFGFRLPIPATKK